jgi:glutaredoxin
MKKLIIYTADWCAVCLALKKMLEHHNIAFTEIDLTKIENYKEYLYEKTGYWGTPGIVLDGTVLKGGFPELAGMINRGYFSEIHKESTND